jgi:hypothetical protein
MSMQEMTAVITRFQAATDALAALGARLGIGKGGTVSPEILAALDEVLAAGRCSTRTARPNCCAAPAARTA